MGGGVDGQGSAQAVERRVERVHPAALAVVRLQPSHLPHLAQRRRRHGNRRRRTT